MCNFSANLQSQANGEVMAPREYLMQAKVNVVCEPLCYLLSSSPTLNPLFACGI